LVPKLCHYLGTATILAFLIHFGRMCLGAPGLVWTIIRLLLEAIVWGVLVIVVERGGGNAGLVFLLPFMSAFLVSTRIGSIFPSAVGAFVLGGIAAGLVYYTSLGTMLTSPEFTLYLANKPGADDGYGFMLLMAPMAGVGGAIVALVVRIVLTD
jgi:hypothetical protein